MKQSGYPIDTAAIMEYGREEWRRDFFWPVTDEDFIKLHDGIDAFMVEQIKKENDFVKRLLIVQCHHLVMEYSNYFHAVKAIEEIRLKGSEPLSMDEPWWYADVMKNSSRCSRSLNTLPGSLPNSLVENILMPGSTYIKSFVKALVFNKFNFLKYFSSLGKKEEVWVCDSITLHIRKYIEEMPSWAHFSSWHNWINNDKSGVATRDQREEIARCAENIISGLLPMARRNGIDLSKNNIAYIKNLTNDKLTETAEVFDKVDYVVKRHKKRIHLILPNVKKPFYQIMSMVVQDHGGRVTNFTHGLNIGFINYFRFLVSRFDTQSANNYVTYTPESAKLYRRLELAHSHTKKRWLNIVHYADNKYMCIRKKYKNRPLKDVNKIIMIIGYGYNLWRQPYAACFSPMVLDLELNIIDLFKQAGYDVVYKIHPGRAHKLESIFSHKARLLKGHYEDCMDEADAYLFLHIGTTPFLSALATNRPVIIFDLDLRYHGVFAEPMELLAKRCAIIRTGHDNANRVTFDREELLNAVAKRPEKPDMGFVEKYLLAERSGNGSRSGFKTEQRAL